MESFQSILERILDNTHSPEQYDRQGILQFGRIFFPDRFSSPFAKLHYDMVQTYFELLDPFRERRLERQSYFITHRESAKSTIGNFLIPMYNIYLKGYKPYVRLYREGWHGGTGIGKFDIVKLNALNESFIVIASETATRSEHFMVNIKTEIDMRGDLAKLFGEKKPDLIQWGEEERKPDGMWRKNAFITSDGTIIIGAGSGQQIRGINIRGHRPTLIIVDDMYSQANTKTEISRDGLNKWFFSELINSASSIEGKILWLGTTVHPDTVIKTFRNRDNWFGVEKPIISTEELSKAIDYCNHDSETIVVPTREKCKEIQKEFSSLSWPERHDLHYILSLYRDNLEDNRLDYFYQEYMNETLAPSSKRIEPDTFYQTDILTYKQHDKQIVEFDWDNKHWKGTALLYIGIDIASSLSAKSDDTVIFLAGFCRVWPYITGIDWTTSESSLPKGMIFPLILHVEGGKYDIHTYGSRKGLCEVVIELCKKYYIEMIVAEANGQQEISVREIARTLIEENLRVSVKEEYVNVNKAERIMSVLVPVIQRYKHIISIKDKLIDKTYMQLLTLGISDHDDYPDALEESFKYARIPSEEIQHDERARKETSYNMKLVEIAKDNAWLYF